MSYTYIDHGGDPLNIEPIRFDPEDSGHAYVYSDGYSNWAGVHLPPDEVPKAAAALLEAKGVKAENNFGLWEGDVSGPSPAAAGRLEEQALWCLQRAAAVREHHARPKVTDEQVESFKHAVLRASTEGPGDWRDEAEALIDAGWTPPADKEGADR